MRHVQNRAGRPQEANGDEYFRHDSANCLCGCTLRGRRRHDVLADDVARRVLFEISESNTVIPLHSWRLVAFRVYWVVLGAAFVAALAHKWIVLLTGGRESDMCELLGVIEGAGAFASVVCAIVCLLGYAAVFDWWAGVTGKMASDSRANDYLLWAVVLTIGTIVEWRIVEGVLKALFPHECLFHGLRFASVCVVTPLLALVPTTLAIIVCALVVGLFAGILFASLAIPVVIAVIGIAIAMSR